MTSKNVTKYSRKELLKSFKRNVVSQYAIELFEMSEPEVDQIVQLLLENLSTISFQVNSEDARDDIKKMSNLTVLTDLEIESLISSGGAVLIRALVGILAKKPTEKNIDQARAEQFKNEVLNVCSQITSSKKERSDSWGEVDLAFVRFMIFYLYKCLDEEKVLTKTPYIIMKFLIEDVNIRKIKNPNVASYVYSFFKSAHDNLIYNNNNSTYTHLPYANSFEDDFLGIFDHKATIPAGYKRGVMCLALPFVVLMSFYHFSWITLAVYSVLMIGRSYYSGWMRKKDLSVQNVEVGSVSACHLDHCNENEHSIRLHHVNNCIMTISEKYLNASKLGLGS